MSRHVACASTGTHCFNCCRKHTGNIWPQRVLYIWWAYFQKDAYFLSALFHLKFNIQDSLKAKYSREANSLLTVWERKQHLSFLWQKQAMVPRSHVRNFCAHLSCPLSATNWSCPAVSVPGFGMAQWKPAQRFCLTMALLQLTRRPQFLQKGSYLLWSSTRSCYARCKNSTGFC